MAEDPVATARAFEAAGAKYIHMVDLDGAKSGQRVNSAIVRAVAGETGLKVELGGAASAPWPTWRLSLPWGCGGPSSAPPPSADPDFVRTAAAQYGERIAVGVDAKDGKVKTAGWVEDSGLDYIAFARRMEALGVQTLIFTDIDTDGRLSGPSWERLEALQAAVSCRIVASGGVSNNGDIERLAAMGLYGVIIGKAYYAEAPLTCARPSRRGEQ